MTSEISSEVINSDGKIKTSSFLTGGVGLSGGVGGELFVAGFFTGSAEDFEGQGSQLSVTVLGATISVFKSQSTGDFGLSLGGGPGFAVFAGRTITKVFGPSFDIDDPSGFTEPNVCPAF